MKTVGEIIGSVPETSLDWESILKERGGSWDNDGYFSEDLVLIASQDWCNGSWHNQFPMLRNSQEEIDEAVISAIVLD